MIGIFIGSFNPPTIAHVEICLKLQKKFTKIVLVPVNSREKYLLDIKIRLQMLNILKRKYPFLEISNIMENYSYLNYRIIDILKKKYGDITLIIGSDLLEKISSFEHYSDLLNNYQFLVIERKNYHAKQIIQEKYRQYQKNFEIIPFNNSLSSSMVREEIKQKKDFHNLLDQDINDYILKHHLYF